MPEEMKTGFEVTANETENTAVEETTTDSGQLTLRDVLFIGGVTIGGVTLIVKGVKRIFGRKKKDYAEVPPAGEYFSRR